MPIFYMPVRRKPLAVLDAQMRKRRSRKGKPFQGRRFFSPSALADGAQRGDQWAFAIGGEDVRD